MAVQVLLLLHVIGFWNIHKCEAGQDKDRMY